MNTFQEPLNTSAESPQLTSWDIEHGYKLSRDNIYNPLGTNNGGLDIHAKEASKATFSNILSTPFYKQEFLPFARGPNSKYSFKPTRAEDFSKLTYLPPQQYGGGMLDELASRDKYFKVQMIDNELNGNYFMCYKWWVMLLTPISFLLTPLFIYISLQPISVVSFWFANLASFLTLWNSVQCFIEFQAVRTRDLFKAEKALGFFGVFSVILFLSSLAMNLTMMPGYMQGEGQHIKIPAAMISSLVAPVLFYLTVISGAVKVCKILRRKHELEKTIQQESQAPTEL